MQEESGHGSRSTLINRNIIVRGRRTSIRIEPEMWKALHQIAEREHCTIHEICSLIALRKLPETTLTAAIRVFLMLYYKAAATEDGHRRAGHGDIGRMRERAEATASDGPAPRPAARRDLPLHPEQRLPFRASAAPELRLAPPAKPGATSGNES